MEFLFESIIVLSTIFGLFLYSRYFFPEYLSLIKKDKSGKNSLNRSSFALYILLIIAGNNISEELIKLMYLIL
jgi:hypothetical protein